MLEVDAVASAMPSRVSIGGTDMTTNPTVRMITDEGMASWCDAEGNYSVTVHAASLTDAALLSSIESVPASAIGSPLYVALLAERDARIAAVFVHYTGHAYAARGV